MKNSQHSSPTHAALAAHFQTTHDHYVVADGSGTTAVKPCGYFAWLVSRGGTTPVWGSASGGTNNYAELAPFLLALHRLCPVAWAGKGVRVLCVSDSEVTVKAAKGEYARGVNGHLWAGLDWFAGTGLLTIDWKWLPRNSLPCHAAADEMSRVARIGMEKLVADCPFVPQEGVPQ